MTDYTLDWSETSVGPTIVYDAPNSTRYMTIDTTNIPTGVGATGALSWYKPADNCNYGFSLPITLASAGTVSFYRMTSTEATWDNLRFFIDGVQQAQWSGATAWGQVSYSLAAGAHTLRWTYVKDSSGQAGEDTVRVALLNITNVSSAPPVTINTNTAGVYDFEDGLIPAVITAPAWINSTSSPISGTRSLRTPTAPAHATAYTATINPTLPENGVIAFDWKRSAEWADYTRVTFCGREDFKNNNTQALYSRHQAFLVPASTSAPIVVGFTKDATINGNEDATWIDNLRVPFQVPAAATISSNFSGVGTLSTVLEGAPVTIFSSFSGEGTLGTKGVRPTIRSSYSGTGVLRSGLGLTRTNLMPAPSVEVDSTWLPLYCTLGFSTEQAYAGTRSLKVTEADAGGGGLVAGYGVDPYTWAPTADGIPVTGGQAYTFSYWVFATAGTPTARATLYWSDGSGYLTNDNGAVTTLTVGSWTRVSKTGTGPAGATQVGLGVYLSGMGVAEVAYADGLLLEKTGTVKDFFDGDSIKSGYTYSWNGTTGASSSTETSVPFMGSLQSDFSGSGTLATKGIHATIRSGFSGTGALATLWANYRDIASDFSGEGTLTTVVGSLSTINANYSGTGTLYTKLSGLPVYINSAFGAEGVLFTELEYLIQPLPLEALPLGKLVRYTINTAGVPLNPAEGSGSTPSVNATYIKGRNPEFALGENFTVDNGAVGRYTGEIVRLSLGKKSDVATISTDTLLTLTNVDKHLYPFIDAAPTTWTAARAIDYWTQQCGAFYDKVDGECAVYASGYGHSNGYAAGSTTRFYEKLTGGTTSVSVIGNRSVTSFGAAVTSSMAQHEAPKTRVPITVGANRKMVFSLGLGIRGTGRTASATYNFIDGADNTYAVAIEATSAGTVTAKVGDAVVATASVPAGDYRVSFSIQRMSDSAMVGKLTVHEDDLAGTGDLIYNGPSTVFSTVLPGTLWLTSLVHASAGGSGAEMLRWGTYLAVAKFHPMTLPAVQKTLDQSKKQLGFVSGFTGNVWKLLNEFCSINRLDVSFVEDRLVVGPRTNGFNGSVKFGEFELTTERREKYKQVAVVNKQSKAVATNDAVFYRADSVFQVAAREVFETTVQTGHSILSLVNPVAVTGIWPFPYTQGAGQYVVTGADGYIVAPQWWADNGGKIEVSLTEKDGEIAIKITAPSVDTVRAPYRISEGAADRPALYIAGSGIVNKPEELHIASGARKAREGFDNVFESPFIATANVAYNTAARMAHLYSAAVSEVSFTTTNDFDTPSALGTYPSGVVFTDNERNFKITDASQTHSQVSGNAVPFTTIAAYVASFPAGSTIADEKARHVGRTIKQANIKPLRSNSESA